MSDDANATTAAPMDAADLARTWEREQASTSRGSLDARPHDGPNASGATSPSTGGGAHDTVTLAWRDIRYTVYPNGKKKPAKEVLKGISGAALPNHVIALMGPTGSGKTSLLNVLSGRVPAGGDLAGDVNVNGKPRGEDFAQRVAYVMQEELLFAFLSVRETFALHARLRLPPSAPDADKLAIVERLVAELGLVAVADSPWDAWAASRGVSPAASANDATSAWRWFAIRPRCFSTSPPAGWIRSRRKTSCRCFATSPRTRER